MSEKQWFAVFTRPQWEKKVSELLSKRGIENFCPLNRINAPSSDRKKTILKPLFTSCVFVRIHESNLALIKKTNGVINFIHWLGKPAVIRDTEIDMIYRFMDEHHQVKLEKTPVIVNGMVRVISSPTVEHDRKPASDKVKTIRIVLPSLGYILSAEVEIGKVGLIRERIHYFSESTGSGN